MFTLMLTGQYRHAVDSKGRVAIPVQFRAPLGEMPMGVRWLDGCAAIFPRDAFEELAAKVAKVPFTDARARDFGRFLFSGAFPVEADRQGRILLPAPVREWCGVEAEALFVGARDHVEIWEPSRWTASQKAVSSAEGLAGHLSGLVIE
jgi:MraZ protein